MVSSVEVFPEIFRTPAGNKPEIHHTLILDDAEPIKSQINNELKQFFMW
jgi:hypothetical protein